MSTPTISDIEAKIAAAKAAQEAIDIPTETAATSADVAVQAADRAQHAVDIHAADMFLHNSPERQAQLDYLVRNYGPAPQTPLPSPSEDPGEEGDWEYLQDADLTAYFSDALMTRDYGRLPVYGVLLPWYNQTTGSAWTATECAPELLPAWCNGTPWLFDSLKSDGSPKQWLPATATDPGVDDYQGEHLWTWWNCNYIRCNNGNRRITAVEGMDSYKEEGDIDVGVMFATRYFYFGKVRLTANGEPRDYTLVVMAGGKMTDPRFPADYKARLQEMGVEQLLLWKECQRYQSDGSFIAAPYGLHSKYFCVLGGEGTTNLKPRSQKGHLLTNISYNQFVIGASVTDGVYYGDNNVRHYGVTNFQAKGAGYFGSGMDRNLFLILHLMIKSGTKDLQKYMTGQVNALNSAVECQLGSTVAAEKLPLVAPGSSVIVTKGAESPFRVNDFVSVGGTGRDFGTTHQARGRILGFYDHIHPDTQVAYTEIVLELQYGKTSFTYTTSHYVTQQLAPSGVTDLVIGHYDGAAYNLTGSHAGPCRVMGTEYGVGALQIFMDVTNEFQTGNVVRLWHASPQTPRQTAEQYIRDTYADLGTYGKSGGYYAADAVVDVEKGTYTQTAPISGSGSSTTGLCDRVNKDNSTSGMRAYWAYGGVEWVSGSDAGLFSVGLGGNYSVLTTGVWIAGVCD